MDDQLEFDIDCLDQFKANKDRFHKFLKENYQKVYVQARQGGQDRGEAQREGHSLRGVIFWLQHIHLKHDDDTTGPALHAGGKITTQLMCR